MLPTELKQFLNSANFLAGAPLRDILDPEKARVLRAIHPHSTLSWRGLSCLYDAACSLERERIAGGIVACGDSTGPAAALISSVLENSRVRPVWVFESSPGSSGLFRSLFLNPRNKTFIKGVAPQQKKDDIGPIALLYVQSMAALRDLYDQVVSGGFLCIESCDRRQLDQFFASLGSPLDLVRSDRGLLLYRK